MTITKTIATTSLVTLSLMASCSDAPQKHSKLHFFEEGAEMEEGTAETRAEGASKPKNPYAAQIPDFTMRLTPGRGQLVRFQQPYLHCGSAQTASNPVAGFFGIAVTAEQALARATSDCNAPPSSFIRACEVAGGAWTPSVNGQCLELEAVHGDSVPVDFYNFGGGVYSDAISVCRVVYCTPKM